MSKKMLMNATQHEENRVAIVEDGILTELDIEVAGHEPTKGNIYRAVVVRVESGLQAAFVDYGAGRLGFLQIDEINYKTVKPDYKAAEDGRRPRITDLLQRGQELLVQIIKEERGTKGAALTTYLSLAGRYMVIMPSSQTRGVSRKAESDSQRKELKQAMASIDMAENIGYIVRTAALNQTREELERDYRYLIRLYESIKELNQKVKAPALLYKESNLIIRSIRDYFTTDMDEVLIDDPQVFKEARDFFKMVMPDQAKLVKLHQERRPIFSRYQIEDQIETLNRNKVPLPSGGSIVIDPTEALVAIDVNSGKMASEQGVEATATKTNIEAAREVGRQLRLRDLGGLVVIDFIDMRDRKHAREVEKELKKSLENDKARVSVGRISQFGLLEMSRQRIKGVLAEGTYLTCPHCEGSGRLKSPETQAAALLRKIHASAAKGQISKLDAHLPLDVATYLLNNKREDLVEMERDHNLQIHIHGNRDFLADQVEIEIIKKEKGEPAKQEFVSAGLLPIPEQNSAKSQDDEVTQQEEAESNKKRRRRRRRKPAANEESQTVVQSTTEAATETKGLECEVTPVTTDTESQQQTSAVEQPKKPQRRRRSPRKQQPAESEQASPATDERAEGQKAQSLEPVEALEIPKPHQSSQEQQAEKTAADSGISVEKPLPKSPGESLQTEQAANEKPKPRRPRRTTRKKAVPVDEDITSTDKNVAAESHSSSEQQVTETRKPVRRGRKPKTDKGPSDQANSNKTAEKQIGKQPAGDTAKPKRRRTPRAATKTAEVPMEAAPKVEEAKTAENKPTEKIPSRRPKKVTKTKTEASVSSDNKPAEQAETKPRTRRGRPRKKPGPHDSPDGES